MDTITINAALMGDLDDLNDLMFDLHDHHHQACPEHFKTAEDIEQEKSIARYLDDPECVVYVARKKGDIIGFITGHFCELISTVSKPIQMGSIDELYVVPEFRQSQVAGQLLDHVELIFEQYGVKQLFVEVWDFNQAAKSFYQKMGFTHHIQWMRKDLSKTKTTKPS